MTPPSTFHEFEHAGWDDPGVASHYDEELAVVTRQSIDTLLAAVAARPGQRLLDVATGAGYVAAAASACGLAPTGVDFSANQIELAKRRYPALGFEVADAAALPFPDRSFDAVVCNFGMLHFPDPDAAVREAQRVLAPGGRFAFTVWDAPERTVALGAVLGAIRAHGQADVGLPAGPPFFQFSDPKRCRELLGQIGFVEIDVRQVPLVWRATSAEAVFETLLHATVRTRATLLAQTPEAAARIRDATIRTIETYRRGGRYELPMPAVLSSGTRRTG